MSNKDGIGASSRQCSVESGLTHAINPVFVCIRDEKLKSKVSDQLVVPQTSVSKMAKIKKKIHSPMSKRKSTSGSLSGPLTTNKIFGVSLEESIKHCNSPPVPCVIVRIVDYICKHGLKSEGIFRVSGNKKNVEMMKAAFDKDNDADLEDIGDIMAVADLLKQYLRELPEPPIPQSLTQEFIKIHEVYGNDNTECLDELKSLLGRLPFLNFQLVKYLCNFLVQVTKDEENNKMSAMALAIVFGPNLFRCKDGLEGLKEQGHTNAIVCKFLQEYENLFKYDDDVNPYATTELFIPRLGSTESLDTEGTSFSKDVPVFHESSTSDEEVPVVIQPGEAGGSKPALVYSSIDKTRQHLNATSVSSSSEELDLYVRSVSPCMLWNSSGNSNGVNSVSLTPHQPQGQPSRNVVQMVIKDAVKEHLFGPDAVSTDDNDCSATDSDLSRVHSAESLDEVVAPPLPARNYGPEESSRPLPRRRKNVKKPRNLKDLDASKEPVATRPLPTLTNEKPDHASSPSNKKSSQLTVDLANMDKQELVISLDQNSNSILQVVPKLMESDDEVSGDRTYVSQDKANVSGVQRNPGNLTNLHLTQNQAPIPKKRQTSSNVVIRQAQHDVDEADELDELCELPKTFAHPLVEEVKSRGVVSTPPPRSPRSPKVSKSPPSPTSPNKHASIDEIDGGYNPVKELTKQYKKRCRSAPVVPPLDLYKLQQGDVGGAPSYPDNLIKHDVQLSPRERYGFNSDEALLSPRSRPLTIDTKSYPTECPPSPPHDHIEHFWSERRLDISPKGEPTLKQITRNIHQLKKKIKEFEEMFEAENGRKPSQIDKSPIKKYLTDLTRCRKQLKELKEKAKEESERLNETAPSLKQETSLITPPTISVEPLLTTTPMSVQQSLDNILRKLQDKRKSSGRSEEVQSLPLEQLQDEKLCVQKALLQHESIFGRPTTKKDKDVMRPLYDRYRLIKRKLNISRTQCSSDDLSTKLTDDLSDRDTMTEHELSSEEQLFATPTLLPKSKTSLLSKDFISNQKKRSELSPGSTDELDDGDDFGGSQETLIDDMKEKDIKLHHMSGEDLQKQVELAKRDKKRLRKKLKKFEDDFLERTGRRVQRDERGDMEGDYYEYKQLKARLRLIDVLLSKRQASLTI